MIYDKITWNILLEEFAFNKKGGFPFKVAVLKIKSFLVASAILICHVITSLEEFSVSLSTVLREILVVDYCNLEKWAHCVNYYLAGWIFHRCFWVFIVNSKTRNYQLP